VTGVQTCALPISDATGITGKVTLQMTGGGPGFSPGVCIDRVVCAAGDPGKGLSMFKCGTAAAGC
jgi:hypothetical protein